MKMLEQILDSHAKEYPLMQPQDGVKLIYQNEFGGGHLIRDPEACRRYLLEEYKHTLQVTGMPLLEPIGNGMVRVMLRSIDACGYSIEQLNEDFLCSSQAHRGERESFLLKVEILRKAAASGSFGFTAEELDAYLAEYKKAGYPVVSHSRQYREAYHPAYRVVQLGFLPKEFTSEQE